MTDEAKALVDRLRRAARDDDEAWARQRWDQAATLIETQAREIERLRDILCFADELLKEAEGAFPFPGNPLRQAYLKIREVSGGDHQTRKNRARAALAGDSHDGKTAKRGTECPYSYDGFHHVDTSMESGPNNCFHCERPMI